MIDKFDLYGEIAYLHLKRKHQSNTQRQYDAYQEKEREEMKHENDIVRN